MAKYVFKPYDIKFPELFMIEKARISSLIQAHIEHIGSTAVPNLGGKAIIDIALGVEAKNLEATAKLLKDLCYKFSPLGSTKNRLFFKMLLYDSNNNPISYYLHLLARQDKEWAELLFFRDFLRKNPEKCIEYAKIKEYAAQYAQGNGEIYRQLKEPFIKSILKLCQ